MTRNLSSPAAPGDALSWSQWLEQQQTSGAAQLEQLLLVQQQCHQAWIQAMGLWWGPWSPFFERGSEQLA